MSFWVELRRRNVFKVAAAYAVVAWLIVQVVAAINEPLDLPDRMDTVVIVLLAIGFPIALLLAWAYELTPEGLKVTATSPGSDDTASGPPRLKYVISGLGIVALGFVVVVLYVANGRRDTESVQETMASPRDATADRLRSGENRGGALRNSIAVLPFANLSPNADDAYFAAGLHEEVLNQLGKLRNLTVISRTTMMQYAGQQKSLPEIARELNVETVMEGSVRFANGRVLVAVQLIDPKTDARLWTESYPGDLSDVFAIQADIAMNVANTMAVEFSIGERAEIERRPTESTEAYALYLATIDHIREAGPEGAQKCLDNISRALQIDPSFVAGWQAKSNCHRLRSLLFGNRSEEEQELARQAALRALDLDPSFAPAHAMLALDLSNRGQWQAAERKYREAEALAPHLTELSRTGYHFRVGHLAAARDSAIAAQQTDPLASANAALLMDLEELEDGIAADRLYERGLALYDSWPTGRFHRLVILLGRKAHAELREFDMGRFGTTAQPVSSEIIQHIDDPEAALAALREMLSSPTYAESIADIQISSWAAYFGDDALAWDALKRATAVNGAFVAFFWMPLFKGVRQLPEFKAHLREIGLVDYWQEFGWPDLCESIGAQDFTCR